YASIGEYYYTSEPIGGKHKIYDWGGGEIWRITASTGAKELLIRSKDSHYVYSIEGVHMDAVNGHIYINDAFNTYRIVEPYDEWEQIIDSVVYPIVSEDEKYIVAMRHGGDAIKYDMTNKTIEVLLTDAGPVSDYDYERNYLLINSNKFVDLNTGEETIIAEITDTIGKYIVSDVSFKNGKIINDYISTEVLLMDTSNYDNEKTRKIRINIVNREYEVIENVIGILSSDGLKYASGYPHSVLITDTLGEWINNVEFEGDEL
ncbi:MAG: hypothetical protein PHW02_05980, partial [bacterium]|nr:hypothetical protein [bacterium]